jgi:hypothetical protein
MGDVSHHQTCVMCFLVIICSALNTELRCCADGCVTWESKTLNSGTLLCKEPPERGDLEGNLLQQLQDQTEHDEGGAFHVFITKH